MTPFTCGCTEDGTNCDEHFYRPCHDPLVAAFENDLPECPPCHLARLRSVSLDGRATPTRRRHE